MSAPSPLSATTMQSPVGELVLVACDTSLRAVLWGDDDNEWKRAAIDRRSVIFQQSAVIELAIAQLKEYFAGDRQVFDLPLTPTGTEFQSTVWKSLTDIKFGSTVSYSEQATSLGRASAVRAVASANGRNPISIVIPCHRHCGIWWPRRFCRRSRCKAMVARTRAQLTTARS